MASLHNTNCLHHEGAVHPSKLPDWSNLEVIHRNTLSPRSSFWLYSREIDALTYDHSLSQSLSLSGTWKFHLSQSPFETPRGFEAANYDTSQWGDIVVPGMWQLQGYGKGPHYTNVQYPFPIDPPHVPYVDNEAGCYVRHFTVPQEFEGQQLRLRFEGVDSAFHVWVNGKEVGYSQGARNPSEFDISGFIDGGNTNTLAVRVVQFSDGSYLEDQDQWWLSGIFREVSLLAFPLNHFQDISLRTDFDENYRDATLIVTLELKGQGNVTMKLLGTDREIVARTSRYYSDIDGPAQFNIVVESPSKWTAETPNLYHLVASINEQSFISQRVGFRQIDQRDGLILINGKRVVFRGVNRHEHHWRYGRAVPFETLRQDLLLMKKHNINAIRTSHQPSDLRLYDLADELGFWVMDEADLECHGFEKVGDSQLTAQQRSELSFPQKKALTTYGSSQWTSNNPAWKAAYLDRAQQLVHRDKLHPSVVIWSLGNESFVGSNFNAMYDWINTVDPTRPIHYEADLDAKVVDMHSMMYPEISELTRLGKATSFAKPLILCEFIHAMGNGPGGIKEYIDAFYEYPRLQGGFAWEWSNHGLVTKNASDEEYFAYGGDFGDTPNDGHFVLDGLCFSNHTPTPGLIEYAKAIEPVQTLRLHSGKIKVINRYDFNTLDHLECSWSVVTEKGTKPGGKLVIPADIQPGQTAQLEVPTLSIDHRYETFLNLVFTLKSDTNWAFRGHELAWGQVSLAPPPLHVYSRMSDSPASLHITQSGTHDQILTISCVSTSWTFNTQRGLLVSIRKSGQEALTGSPVPSFYRPLTDNDRGQDGYKWQKSLLHHLKNHVRAVKWSATSDAVTITVEWFCAPPVLSWRIECMFTYVFSSSGSLFLHVAGKPSGANAPETLPRIGLEIRLVRALGGRVKWWGRGPGESYRDSKESQRIGLWQSDVQGLWTDYEFPQEGGNRTDTRWVQFSSRPVSSLSSGSNEFPQVTSSDGNGNMESTAVELQARFVDPKSKNARLFDWSASLYDMQDVDNALHAYELRGKEREEVIVRLDAAHHGLGSGSCGPKTYEWHALKTAPFEFEVELV